MGTVPEASGGEQAPIVAAEAAPVAGSAAPATPTSGLLVVDKPRGVTSHDIVAAARGALHMKKVGHAGTLDPMATGVLVVGFGNATRLLNHISNTTRPMRRRFASASPPPPMMPMANCCRLPRPSAGKSC